MSQPSKQDVALKELEILQAVIARQDEFKEKAKVLAVALFSAVSVGFLSGQVTLSPLQYFLASFGVCLAFMILEGAYGTTEINAETRVRKIEDYLRATTSDQDFQSPDITGALLREGTFTTLWQSVLRWRTLFFYGLLVLLSGLVAVFVTPSVPASEADRKLLLEISELRQHSHQLDTDVRDRLSANSKDLEMGLNKLQQSFKQELENAVKKMQPVPKTE